VKSLASDSELRAMAKKWEKTDEKWSEFFSRFGISSPGEMGTLAAGITAF